MNTIRKNTTTGVTLIEMMVGFSIFAVISLSIYVTYSQGVKLNQRSQIVGSHYRQAKWAMTALTKDLGHLVSYRFPLNENKIIHEVQVNKATLKNVAVTLKTPEGLLREENGVFWGNANSLAFVIVEESGLMFVRYFLADPKEIAVHKTVVDQRSGPRKTLLDVSVVAEKTKVLLREKVPFADISNPNIDNIREPEVLCLNIKESGLTFSYAPQADKTLAPEITWQDQWDRDGFPAGLRMELTLHDPNSEQGITMQKDILIPRGAWGRQ